MKKVVSLFVGLLALAAIIFTGYLSFTDEQGYLTVLYGIVTAILAPASISLIQWAYQKPDKTLEQLNKIPAIQQLLEEVRQYEAMVKSLKDEREKLLEIIQKESRLYMLQERKASLEANMKSAQDEIAEIDSMLKEEPNARYKYLPDIVKTIEKDTQKTEPSLEVRLINTLFSSYIVPFMPILGKLGYWLISNFLIANKSKGIKEHQQGL